MFGHRFFGARYYGPRYFGDGGSETPVPTGARVTSPATITLIARFT
jgi:hypothetical protein